MLKRLESLKKARAWRETIIACRFALVGLLATVLHIIVVWLVLASTNLHPLIANSLAYCSAFVVSFYGNYLWVFDVRGERGRALKRFLLSSLIGISMNNLLLSLLLTVDGLKPAFSATASAAIVAIGSFLAGRLWVFH